MILKEYKRLFSNVSWLGSVQALNLLFPLLYLPYATRIVGPSLFGEVEYAINIIVYFTIAINYGFYYSGTKEVSINRENSKELTKVVSEILCSKLVLGLILGCVYIMMIIIEPKFITRPLIYYIGFFSLVGASLTPWFVLQGLEKFKNLAGLMFCTKLLSLIFVFSFLKTESDYFWLVIVNSGPELIVGVLTFFQLRRYDIAIDYNYFKNVLKVLKRNFYVFANEYVILLLVNSIVLLMGFYVSKDLIGNYIAAYKIVGLVQVLLLSTAVKTLFPFFAKQAQENLNVFKSKFFRLQFLFFLPVIIVCVSIFFNSDFVVKVIYGSRFSEAEGILRIFAFLPFFMAVSAYYGWIGLITMRKERILFLITLIYGFVTIISLLIFSDSYGVSAFAFTRLITEILMSATLLIAYTRYSKKI